MSDKQLIWIDQTARNPSENIAINRECVNQIQNKKYDLIARFYTHKKGIILGNSESSQDVNIDYCTQNNYEVIRRPSGGSAIVVEPDLTLCYSLFFSNPSKFDINEIYKKITLPLARNLGEKFSIKGNYYLRFENNGKSVPIAGHAMKSYGDIIQFDGVINKKAFDVEKVARLIKLRELYQDNQNKYISVNKELFDLKGKKVNLRRSQLKLIRSEKKELEDIVGLQDICLSERDFINTFRTTLEELFGHLQEGEISINNQGLLPYAKESKKLDNHKKRIFLGHCFVDLIDEELKN